MLVRPIAAATSTGRQCLYVLGIVAIFYLQVSASELTIRTSDGKGADAEVRKNRNEIQQHHDSGHGDASVLNVRHDPMPGRERNEVVLLRFDLSQIKPDQIENARLELTSFSSFHKNRIVVYGVRHSVEGQNWNENSVKFSDAPALTWDNQKLSDRGLVDDDVIRLGMIHVPRADAGMNFGFTSEALTRFLQDPAWEKRDTDPNVVTFLLMLDTASRGQRRFRSKEFPDSGDSDAPRLILLTH